MLANGAVNGVKHPIEVEGVFRHDLATYDGSLASTKERVIQDESSPFRNEILNNSRIWVVRSPWEFPVPNLPFLRAHFYKEGRLSNEQAIDLILRATMIMREEPNLLKLSGPINICGDIHGQYYDLLQIFNYGGDPSLTSYLFLGDYVDRGKHSMECILLLYALKVAYPKGVHLLRGNHESFYMTSHFSFRGECIQKYSIEVYEACIKSFQALPLAALLNEKYLCVHGGISPHLQTPDDINTKVHRFQEPPNEGLMCDLLWSDPSPDFDYEMRNEPFPRNVSRNTSVYFSFQAVKAFLDKNKLFSIIRAHQVQEHGFRLFKNHIRGTMPEGCASIISVFSAPNYVGRYNNQGAFIIYNGNAIDIKPYTSGERPSQLPNAFEWSLPFVAQQVSQLLLSILNQLEDEDLPLERQTVIRRKIFAVGTMARVFSVLRANAELNHGYNLPPEKYPHGPLMLAESGLPEDEVSFKDIEQTDRVNEGNPEPDTFHQLDEDPALQRIIDLVIQRPSSDHFENLMDWSSLV